MRIPKLAVPGTVLFLGARFATKVGSFGVSEERVQQAIDDDSDPLWVAVTNVFCPQHDALTLQAAREKAARPCVEILSERPKPCAKRSVDEQVASLKEMYTELGWTFTESGLAIPERQNGIDRLIMLADPALTNNRLYGVCDASFACWRYACDLDADMPAKNDQRHPSRGSYAIWVRDHVGPDQDLMGLSAKQISARGLKTQTILERMLLEFVHFRETGQHLDSGTLTLCAGSRNSDGFVPYAGWNDSLFKVDWYGSDSRSPNIGPRQAVSL